MTLTRVVHRRRTGLIAALAAVLFLVGLLGFEARDDAWLLKVAGQPMDLRGAAAVAWQNAWRDCSSVQRRRVQQAREGGEAHEAQDAHDAHDAQKGTGLAAAVHALREFSPPDSRSARVLQVDEWTGPLTTAVKGRTGARDPAAPAPTWWALQAQFDALEAVVVLVRQGTEGVQVVPEGVWSGTTRPWDPAWRIRRFMGQRVADAPQALLACLDPLEVFAQPPRPL